MERSPCDLVFGYQLTRNVLLRLGDGCTITSFQDAERIEWIAITETIAALHPGEEFIQRAEGDQASGCNDAYAIAQTLRLFHVVRRKNDSRPRVNRLTNHTPHDMARCRIKPRCRFV